LRLQQELRGPAVVCLLLVRGETCGGVRRLPAGQSRKPADLQRAQAFTANPIRELPQLRRRSHYYQPRRREAAPPAPAAAGHDHGVSCAAARFSTATSFYSQWPPPSPCRWQATTRPGLLAPALPLAERLLRPHKTTARGGLAAAETCSPRGSGCSTTCLPPCRPPAASPRGLDGRTVDWAQSPAMPSHRPSGPPVACGPACGDEAGAPLPAPQTPPGWMTSRWCRR